MFAMPVLNLKLSNHIWNECLNHYSLNPIVEKNKATYVVEYSSPNTNKPLHLGHIRNNLLGKSVCNLLKSVGHNVVETNLVNDRGIHICKSMLAWKKYGSNETPESSQLKGDHLVGKYYVKFDQKYKEQIQEGIQKGQTEKEAKELADGAPSVVKDSAPKEEAEELKAKLEEAGATVTLS